MSHTDAHTPHYVNALHDKNAVEVHRGCEHDPSGMGRRVGVEEVERTTEPLWPLVPVVHRYYSSWAGRYVSYEDGLKWVFKPRVETVKVPVYEVVPCDIDDDSGRTWRSCHRESEAADVETFGYRHKCEWHGTRRDKWYVPERQSMREYARQAAAEYNTFGDLGELEDAEPYTPGSPSGLWGGGWPD